MIVRTSALERDLRESIRSLLSALWRRSAAVKADSVKTELEVTVVVRLVDAHDHERDTPT
jgi:hypothetical protein